MWVKGEEHAAEMIKQVEKLKTIIGSYFLIESEGPLEEVLGKVLKDKKLSISLAESCSGGYIAHLFTSLPGASVYFKG